MIPEHIFRAYDIRGVYNLDLNEDTALNIGRAVSTYLDGQGKNFVVGRDVRLSGPSLEDALIGGLISGGCNVEGIGVVTTPILYFSAVHYSKDGGVMVSASHNPPDWNGFKIWTKDGFICEGKGMEDLKEIAINKRFEEAPKGRLKKNLGALSDYKNFVLNKVKMERRLKVAIDPGNGSCSVLVPDLFLDAGTDVVAINAEPDGRFPAHAPEPNKETLRELIRLVVNEEADFGVGFDGDGDRAVFIDDKGRIVPADSVLIILTEYYLEKNKGASIVYEVSVSMNVEETVLKHGGRTVLSRVGHTYIVEKMLQERAVFGGESSGHFYFSDVYCFDDALYASLKLAEVLSKRGEKFSEIVDSIPRYPRMPVKNYDCPDEKKFKVVEKLKNEFRDMGVQTVTIDGVKLINPEGWFLIRPSNTQPQIRLTVESKSRENLEKLTLFAEQKILEAIRSLCNTSL